VKIARLAKNVKLKPRLQLCVGGCCLNLASIAIERRCYQFSDNMLPQSRMRQYLENALAILFSYGLGLNRSPDECPNVSTG
jgi:hypothetical protein